MSALVGLGEPGAPSPLTPPRRGSKPTFCPRDPARRWRCLVWLALWLGAGWLGAPGGVWGENTDIQKDLDDFDSSETSEPMDGDDSKGA